MAFSCQLSFICISHGCRTPMARHDAPSDNHQFVSFDHDHLELFFAHQLLLSQEIHLKSAPVSLLSMFCPLSIKTLRNFSSNTPALFLFRSFLFFTAQLRSSAHSLFWASSFFFQRSTTTFHFFLTRLQLCPNFTDRQIIRPMNTSLLSSYGHFLYTKTFSFIHLPTTSFSSNPMCAIGRLAAPPHN